MARCGYKNLAVFFLCSLTVVSACKPKESNSIIGEDGGWVLLVNAKNDCASCIDRGLVVLKNMGAPCVVAGTGINGTFLKYFRKNYNLKEYREEICSEGIATPALVFLRRRLKLAVVSLPNSIDGSKKMENRIKSVVGCIVRAHGTS